MSLTEKLYNRIKRDGSCSLDELHYIAESDGHKQSTAEGLLRVLTRRGTISPIKNERGFISGYRHGQFKPDNNWYEVDEKVGKRKK